MSDAPVTDTKPVEPAQLRQPPLWIRLARTPLGDLMRGHITGHQSAKKVIAEADVPPRVRSLVSGVVRKTRLWQAERADVARELISHFESGLRGGRSESELVGSFGDTATAIKLIRRARKRQRLWVWLMWMRMWKGVGFLTVLLMVVYGWAAIRVFGGVPSPSHDYLAELNRTALAVPEAKRAWPVYRSTFMALPDLANLHQIVHWSPETGPEVSPWPEWLAEHQSTVAGLRAAAGMSGLGFAGTYLPDSEDLAFQRAWSGEAASAAAASIDDESVQTRGGSGEFGLVGVQLPHLSTLRSAALILAADAEAAMEEGDSGRALADLEAIISTAGFARELPILINDLVGLSVLNQALSTSSLALRDHPSLFSDEQFTQLAHRLGGFGGGGDVRVRLSGERMFFEDLIQHLYTDDGHGDGHMTMRGMRALAMLMDFGGPNDAAVDLMGMPDFLGTAAAPVAGLIIASRRDMSQMHASIMNDMELEASLPLWQRTESPAAQRIEQLAASTIDAIRYSPIIMLMPAISKASIGGEMVTQQRDALLAAIALELFHRRTGEWPDSLSELLPRLLPSLPVDRFDGQPLRYVVTEDGPLLYSIGTDLDDDGGRRFTSLPDAHQGGSVGRWIAPEQVAALKAAGEEGDPSFHSTLPDADWVLWPMDEDG